MLLSEFELLYWFHVLEKYLSGFAQDRPALQTVTANGIRLLFFQTAMFVKKFLMQMQLNDTPRLAQQRREQIVCIEAYLKTYHYRNFDEMYLQFDRQHFVLLNDDYRTQLNGDLEHDQGLFGGENYEQFSYLVNLKVKDIHMKFGEMRLAFQNDDKDNVIDYNWHVDGILKNSQSYNKEGKNGGKGKEDETP